MEEIRLTFHQQLDDIRRDLVRTAGRVIETIARGTETLLALDLGAARELIAADKEINDLTLDIEERCFRLLVLQQPMAGDMRTIVSAIRLASEIERSGDLMVNVAKAARRLYGSEIPPKLRGLITMMSEEAARLFRLAMDAFAEGDAELANALDDLDDRLDSIHRDFVAAILDLYADARDVQMAVQLALVGRYYERIGDHAVNIGERVTYMVTGEMPDHHAKEPASPSQVADPPGDPEPSG